MSVDSYPARSRLGPKLRAGELASGAQRRLGSLALSRRSAAALVLALTTLSLLLRVGELGFHFWVDEGISVGISSHPLSQLPALLREDGSPPLYYALLHVWMSLWGRGEVATHVLSLIFALASVPAAYWSGASLLDRRSGAYAAVLAAGLPFLTSYAQETRMYSLLVLLSLLATASFVHVFVFRRRRHLPMFVLSLTAALYTHNWALFLGLAAFIAFLLRAWPARGERRAVWRDGALAFGTVALLYLPWVPTLLYQAQHTGAPWALAPNVWSLSQGAYFLVGGRGAAVALLLAAGSGLLTLRHRAARPGERAPGSSPATAATVVALLVLGLGTLAIAWAYAKLSPAWAFRYLAVIVGPLLLAAAAGLRRASGLGVAALALVCCFWVLDPRPSSPDAKSNVAAAVRAIRPELTAGTLVLSTQPEQVPALDYYVRGGARFATPLGPVSDPRTVDWRGALERFRHSSAAAVLAPMLASLTPGQRVALVLPTRFTKTPEWMSLIHRASVDWTSLMMHDPGLRLLRVVAPHGSDTGVGVRIALFVATARGSAAPGH